MRIRDLKMIFKDAIPEDSIILDTTMSDMLKIQIEGSGNCDIKVYGQLTNLIDFSELAIIRDIDYSLINSISEKGIYTISTEGCRNIKIEVNFIEGDLMGYVCEVGVL